MDDADTPLLLGERRGGRAGRGGRSRGSRSRGSGSSGRGGSSINEESSTATTTKATTAPVPDVPFLSSGPAPEEEETTEFSRLIARQSTSFNEYDRDVILNAQHNVNPFQLLSHRHDPTTGATSANANLSPSQQRHHYYRTFIALWTLSILHLGFVWGSYMADSWSETRLYVSLFGSSVKNKMETSMLIRNTNLASIVLSSLDNKVYTYHLPILAILVCLTCLILPCAFMIASPSWILIGGSGSNSSSSNNNSNPQQQQQSTTNNHIFTTRNVLELMIRFGYMIVYVFVIVDIAVSFIKLSWTDTTITIQSTPRAGFGCYVVAISCAVTFTMVLRLCPLPIMSTNYYNIEAAKPVDFQIDLNNQGYGENNNASQNNNRPNQQQPLNNNSGSGPTRSPITPPPPHAFRHNNSNNNELQQQEGVTNNDVVGSEVSMTVLEDSPPSSSAALQQQQPTPQLQQQQDPPSTFTATTTMTTKRCPMLCNIPRRISFCYKVFIFQIGLLAVVFWMPSLYLPIVSYKYKGFISDLMYYNDPSQEEETTTKAAATNLIIYLSDIPQMIWTTTSIISAGSSGGGRSSETAQSNAIICMMAFVFVMSIFVFPVLGTLLGIFTWIGEGRWTKHSRKYLYSIQPALGGLVFITVLLLLVAAGGGNNKNNSAIGMLFDSLLVGGDSDGGLCTQIKKWNIIKQQRDCLALDVQLLPGAWFYMVQTILLEVFVAATLLWSESS